MFRRQGKYDEALEGYWRALAGGGQSLSKVVGMNETFLTPKTLQSADAELCVITTKPTTLPMNAQAVPFLRSPLAREGLRKTGSGEGLPGI